MANVIISDVQNLQTTIANSTSLIALVPGNTPQGPYEPTLVSSVQEFTTTFGSVGIPTSPTHDYVKGILASGTRVLFLRIDSGSMQAEGSLDDKVKFTASAAGTDGNKLYCQFTTTNTDPTSSGVISFTVFEAGEGDIIKTIETHTVCSFLASTAADIDRQIFSAIPKIPARSITIELGKDVTADNLKLFETLKTAPVTKADSVQLSGGVDGSEDTVRETLKSDSVNPFLEAGLSDKFTYNFDYITSGEYVDTKEETGIAKNLLMTALSRKECTAILELEMTTKPSEVTSWFRSVLPQLGLDLSYARSATNWVYEDEKWHAGSYSFLKVMGRTYSEALRTLAGTDYATSATNSAFPISESLLLNWQDSSLIGLNPICKIGNFGYVLFGQSTLATPRAGSVKSITDDDVRQMTNRIKKSLLIFSLQTLFKIRSLKTWNEFSSKVSNYLDKFVAEESITSYDLTVSDSTDGETLKVLLAIDLPLAIETIEIEMALTSSNIIFE